MRTFIILMLGLLTTLSTRAQDTIFQEVVKVDLSKEELYSSLRLWVYDGFRSPKDVIQYEDQESGTIIVRGSLEISPNLYLTKGYVYFSLKLESKDGRFRYTFEDFDHIGESGTSGGSLADDRPDCGGLKMTKGGWKMVKEQRNETIEAVILSITDHVKSENDNDEDW
jgi:hypothetical protein